MQKTLNLLLELGENFSETKFSDFFEHLNVLEEKREPLESPVFQNRDCYEQLNDQSIPFYQYLADLFLSDITSGSVSYFMFWKPVILDYLDEETYKKFLSCAFMISMNDNEKLFIKGLIEHYGGDFMKANEYFKRSQIDLRSLFMGSAYINLFDYNNAILSYAIFDSKLAKELAREDQKELFEFEIYNLDININLGYCHSKLEKHKEALSYYQTGFEQLGFDNYLELCFNRTLDSDYPNRDSEAKLQDAEDSEIEILSSYLKSLYKTQNCSLGIEVCGILEQKVPNLKDLKFYKNWFEDFQKKNDIPKRVTDNNPIINI